MSYVKNNWTEGDIITAEKLNNIENGVSEVGGVYEIELTEEELEQAAIGEVTRDITSEEFQKLLSLNTIKVNLNDSGDYISYFLYRSVSLNNTENIIFQALINNSISATVINQDNTYKITLTFK